jgi:hypothetical protein
MPKTERNYPEAAYTGEGTLWWDLQFHPGKRVKFGDSRKLAAWLAFNLEVGESFTMPELRDALGDGIVPNRAEHLNRRLRELRDMGWQIPSSKDLRSLEIGQYRITAIGWYPGSYDPKPRQSGVSQAQRRRVIERDGRRCVICGVGSGEPYPGEPTTNAALTVGHRFPNSRGGKADLNNLQAECKRCNEPVRQEMGIYESVDDLIPDLRALRKAELTKIHSWLVQGHRTRDRTDELFDRIRKLTSGERERVTDIAIRMLDEPGKAAH